MDARLVTDYFLTELIDTQGVNTLKGMTRLLV